MQEFSDLVISIVFFVIIHTRYIQDHRLRPRAKPIRQELPRLTQLLQQDENHGITTAATCIDTIV